MDDSSFIRYLASKKSVDDRALNLRIWNAMVERASREGGPRVLEIGGGIGTMIKRVAAIGEPRPASYTMFDAQPALIEEARRRLAGADAFPVELIACDLDSFLASAFIPFDLVIANAFLDLFDPAVVLPGMSRLCRPGGLYLFSITFDGLTAFEPEMDADLDRRVVELYHRNMDERIVGGKRSGDSRCGRHLLNLLPACGYRIIEAGPSDWIVHPRDGGYPSDERYFLSCILSFVEESLSARPELGRAELRRWLERRRAQLSSGELAFLAHQLDVLAELRGA